MAPTRRERQRTETLADIKAAAYRQIQLHGASELSLRAIARDIGMSPAGLYRYFDGLDELVTALLVDAYNDLADRVVSAIGADDGEHRASFIRGVLAYRRWAVAHPNRFLLIFGTPIPGYAAPEGGPTVEANARMGQAFMEVGARAWTTGAVAAPSAPAQPTAAELDIAERLGSLAPGFPVGLVGRMLSAWAHWHGLVILEVTNQLEWVYPDATAFFTEQAQRIADGLWTRGPGPAR